MWIAVFVISPKRIIRLRVLRVLELLILFILMVLGLFVLLKVVSVSAIGILVRLMARLIMHAVRVNGWRLLFRLNLVWIMSLS